MQNQWARKAATHQVIAPEFSYDSSAGCLTPTSPNPPVCTTTVIYPITSADPNFQPQQVDTYTAQQITQHVMKPSSSGTLTESYQYDNHGFRKQVTDPRGNVTSLCYDVDYSGASVAGSLGNLTRTISPPPAGGANPLVSLIKYDAKNNAVGNRCSEGVTNGCGVTYHQS